MNADAAEVYLYPGRLLFVNKVIIPLISSMSTPVRSVKGRASVRNHSPPARYSSTQRKRTVAAVLTIIEGNRYFCPRNVGVVIIINSSNRLMIGYQAQMTGGINPSINNKNIIDATTKLIRKFNRFPVLNRKGNTRDNQT